jgi:hypothetical protein
MVYPVHGSPFETAKVKRSGLEEYARVAGEGNVKLERGYAFALRIEGGRKRSH